MDAAAPLPPSPPPAPPRTGRRALARLLAVLLALGLAAALLLGGLWAAAGAEGSLAWAARQLPGWLPAGQSLSLTGVSGSLRHGGRIDTLQWQRPGQTLRLSGVELAWSWNSLWARRLVLKALSADEAVWEEDGSRPASPAPTDFRLPLALDTPLRLGRLSLPQQAGFEARGLQGHYRYDGRQHRLTLDQAQVAAGVYQGQFTLQDQGDLALQLQGQLPTRLPAPARLAVAAQLSGPLAGANARLALRATLQPLAADGTPLPSAGPAPRAELSATVAPWAAQPLGQADARLSHLDAAALWPGAPRTDLSGTLALLPPAAGQAERWTLRAELDNARPGPWDRQALPLGQLRTRAHWQGGRWTVEQLQARLGPGQIEGQGQWQPGPAGHLGRWEARLNLRGLNPADLHSQLPAGLIDGRLHGQPRPQGPGVDFEAALQQRPGARAGGSGLWSAVQLRDAQARGHWQPDAVVLDTLQLRLAEATLSGPLRWQARTGQVQADLVLQAPGTQAQIQGQWGEQAGQGQLLVQVQEVGALSRWLARWPGLAQPAWPALRGQARLQGQWNGGWGGLRRAWLGQRGPYPALGLKLTLELPDLRAETPPNPTGRGLPEPLWQLQGVQLQLQGPLVGAAGGEALQLSARGQLRRGAQAWTLDAQASAPPLQAGTDRTRWSARLEQARLQADNALPGGRWSLALQAPQELTLERQAAPQRWTLLLAPGSATLSSPGAAQARASWQASRWEQRGSQQHWSSSGQLSGIPLAWLEQVAALRTDTRDWGISGDMVFDGQWTASADPRLRVEAQLQRQRGDLRLQADDDPGADRASASARSAGAREARLSLRIDAQQVDAEIAWDSERAGQLQGRLRTTLADGPEGWLWPAQAPLSGRLQASLPRLGVWSVLAPPGWRMRGTLEAAMDLSGTRTLPQWTGQIQADNLALRSVVEGVELRNGRLRATFTGRQVQITEFTLQGAPGGGSDGGRLSATGQAQWTGTQLQLALQAQARQLRVSARADRRLAVSGDISARLDQGQARIEGQLKADQALFILPDETAPRLGSDVVVRPGAHPGGSGAGQRPATAPPADEPVRPRALVQVTLDLGDDFRVQGRGLNTRLQGTLALRISPEQAEPRVSGELRTERGTYKAYGQQLNIETGVLRFSGAYDNPALDILAIRPNLSVRVGVQISGSVLSPRVRLFAEPEMADADKLAWLVLGRAAASGAAESALLQQAALALLGGGGRGLSDGLARSLGLDEVSFSGVRNTDTGVSSAAITLGKRLSRDFYLSYERSLAGTLGTFYVFYDLSRRFTLRAQTGEKSAIDLIFTLRYD